MGIEDLYLVIKENAPDQIINYHLSELTGYRFAVDISVFLYKFIRSAGEKQWMNTFMLLMCTLKKHGIKAVCIFDGPNPPPEKKEEQERRRAENQKAVNRLSEAIRVRNLLQDDYILCDNFSDESLMKEIRGIIGTRRNAPETVNYRDVTDIVDSLNDLIEKLERQTIPITEKHRDTAMLIVEMMGLHAIQAPGEAETLCAYLAVTGQVDAVLTEDTDVLAYGTPLMVAFKDYKLSDEKLVGIYLPGLLDELGLNVEEFRDLCILLSCDYNSRVKGYPPDGKKRKKAVGIGAKGALCMIKEYRRLEKVCQHVEDPKPLKYRRCRELFTVPKSVNQDLVPYNLKPDYVRLDAFIIDQKLTVKVPYIAKCYKPAILQFEDNDDQTHGDSADDDKYSESEGFFADGNIEMDLETEPSQIKNVDNSVYVVLSSMCVNEEDDEKCIEAHFRFANQKIFDDHDGTLFDEIIEPFNEWLNNNGYEGWCVDDEICTDRIVSADEAINPYLIAE